MRIFLIACLISFSYINISYSQDVKINVPAEIQEYMTSKYPKVGTILYDLNEDTRRYLASFNYKGYYMEVLFVENVVNNSRRYVAVSLSKDIAVKEIPSVIKNNINASYSKAVIQKAKLVEHYMRWHTTSYVPDNQIWYVIEILYEGIDGEIRKEEITFDKKGNIIPKLLAV